MSCDGSPYRYSGSTMTTEDYSANAMASIIASCTSVGVQGAASLPRCECENARKRSSFSGTMDLSDYDIGEEDGLEDCLLFGGKKRRLTFEQVKRLEKSFEVANKLEPERKIQLAKALGLQPRQIAVWFQNRRARCKTKQVEKDFDGLKKEYDALKSKYDILLEENKRFKAERLNRESGNNNQNSADVRAFDFEIEPQQNSTNSVLQPTDFPMELSAESNVCRKCAAPLGDIYSVTAKEQEGGCCSIVSEVASSLLNIDSPLTIDSPPSPRFSQIIAAAANSSPVIAVEGSSFGEQIVAGGLESPPPGNESHCLQETLPEVEVDQIASLNQADVTCRNLFYSLDEQGPLNLWEYWPQ